MRTRETMLLAIVSGLCLAASPSRAEPGCPSDQGTASVSVSVMQGGVTVNNGYSRNDLQRIKQKKTGGAAPSGLWHLLGLTVTEFRLNMRVNVRVYQINENRFCALAESLNVSVGYPDFTVYIDRKYRRGSCEYRMIRTHEDEHVDIYRDNLMRYAPLLRKELTDAVQALGPLYAASADRGAEQAQAFLQAKIKPLIDNMQRTADDLNAAIDTRQSYESIQGRCGNW